MMRKILFLLLILTGAIHAEAQLKAKAISYTLDVDLKKFDPHNADQVSNHELKFETDVYYTADKVRTVNRPIKRPEGYDLTFRQRLYDQLSKDEYNVEYENKFMVVKEGHAYKPKATGKKKTILNYPCKEYTVADYQGRTISFWVTDKLGKNVCPWGNFSLKGTALEVTTSFGLHFTATDFAEGDLDANFFAVPTDFKSDKIPFAAPAKGK
jgi:GLPGLI family protein